MLNKKIKSMIAIGLATSPLVQSINPILAYAEENSTKLINEVATETTNEAINEVTNEIVTKIETNEIENLNEIQAFATTTNSSTGVTTQSSVANINKTTSTSYSSYFTVPEGVTNAKFSYYISINSSKYGDRAYLYLYEYDLDSKYIATHLLINSSENYQITKPTSWGFNPTVSLNSGRKYRLQLMYHGVGSGTAITSSHLSYTETPEGLMNVISENLKNVKTQDDVNTIQSLINTTQNLINNITEEDRKLELQENLDLLQRKLNIEESRLYVEKAEMTYLQVDLDKAQGYVSELHDCQEKIDLQNRINILQNLINDNYIKIQEAIEAIVVAEDTQAQADINYAQSLINELLNTPEKTNLQNRLSAVSATNAVRKVETTYSQTDYNSAKTLVNSLVSSEIKTSLNNRLIEVQKVISAISDVDNAENIKTKDSLIKARTNVNNLKDSEIKVTLNHRLDILQSIVAVENDKLAPNKPVINFNDDIITISAEDIEQNETVNIDKTDTFETTKFEHELTGDWVRTSQQRYNGSYSLASSNTENSTTSTMTVKFKVASGATGLLSFRHLVKSETNYDKLIITLNGSEIINRSGNGSWELYSKTLSAGDYTLEIKYKKDGSRSNYDDRAYIDDLYIKGQTVINNLPSGVKKIEYQINGGEWTEYKEGFKPRASGEVEINARATDYAGNVSEISTETIVLKGSLDTAKENVEILDNLAKNLTTQDKINEALEIYENTVEILDTIDDGEEKETIKGQLENFDKIIKEAQAIVNATIKVEVSEQTLSKTDLDNALELVQGLQDGEIKQGLLNRLIEVEYKLTLNTTTESVIKAETTMKQEDVTKSMELVEDLRDEDKATLKDRLDKVQTIIDTTIIVERIETNVNDISTEDKLNSVAEDIESAKSLIETITNETVKNDLTERVNVANEKVNVAKAILSVEKAENEVTRESVDTAKNLVATLQDEELKESLTERLQNVEIVVNEYELSLNLIQEFRDILFKSESTGIKDLFSNKVSNLSNSLKELDNKAKDSLNRLENLPKGTPAMESKKDKAISNVKKVRVNTVILTKLLKLFIIPIKELEKLFI